MDTVAVAVKTEKVRKIELVIYKIFCWFVIGGVMGFLIETVWCWFDFGEFTSRTSNLFFPMSCVWGMGCVLICILQCTNKQSNQFFRFVKNAFNCAAFELLCGWFGELYLGVTFWDYSGMPLHIGKYINLPFCLGWGLLSLAWGKWIYPTLDAKLEKFFDKTKRTWIRIFIVFMVVTNLISWTALVRMKERQSDPSPSNYIEKVYDQYFPDPVLQKYFPKMKDAVSGEKIYLTKAD
ncbi:MAG: hypothetical protein EOM40_05895 [Clostridia bacterium]|nr:hypothetical protein [Clostridia bacterium]